MPGMMPQTMPGMMPQMGNYGMQPNNQFMNYEGNVLKLKNGKNTNFNSILENVNSDDLIPVIPEMQQLFSAENISRENPQEYSSELNFGNEPKIMDRGLLNNNNIPSFISGSGVNNPLPANITNQALSSLNNLRGGNNDFKKKKHFFLTKQ